MLDGELKLIVHIVRSGLCTSGDLGNFITSFPSGISLNSTSIFTSALKFSASSFPVGTSNTTDTGEINPASTTSADTAIETGPAEAEDGDSIYDDIDGGFDEGDGLENDYIERWSRGFRRKRQWGDDVDGTTEVDGGETDLDEEVSGDAAYADDDGVGSEEGVGGGYGDDIGGGYGDGMEGDYSDNDGGDFDDTTGSTSTVPVYSAPITYAVQKTGYYCIGTSLLVQPQCGAEASSGIVPVTLVNSRDTIEPRQATHAEYSGSVLFRNTFVGELPAVEYPKINVSQYNCATRWNTDGSVVLSRSKRYLPSLGMRVGVSLFQTPRGASVCLLTVYEGAANE